MLPKAIAHTKSPLWLKNSNSKKHVKIHSTNHLELFCAKKPLQKTLNIGEMRAFKNRPSCMQRLYPMQNPHFGSKIKIPKSMSKSILQIISSCSVQKTAPKNTKYSRNESVLKFRPHACKGYSPQKLKFQKTSKSILQIIFSRSAKQTAPKNTKYSRNGAF